MQTIFNPLDKYFKSILGAVNTKDEVTFRVKGNFNSVVFIYKFDKDKSEKWLSMDKKDGYFEITLSFPVGLYFYCFSIGDGQFIGADDNLYGVISCNPNYFQLTAYKGDYFVPNWLNGGVIYQIFPDRFYRAEKEKTIGKNKILHTDWLDTPTFNPNEYGQVLNNDFFGGDIKGIIEKLEYLSDLGVTCIYLNPIFKAYSNHRYDTGDYMTIDPLLGDEKDFISLINKANEKGIKIVLDGVFNHTGDDSLYFNKYGNYDQVGAYQSKDSKYFGWYNFKDYPNDYDAWWGIKILPAVNENNQGFIDFITGKDGVLEHYTKMGIGGWRLDVVDELPAHFVKSIRRAVKLNNEQAIIIGEVWEDASNKISYGVRREYFQGEELDSVMNYPLKNAILNYVNYNDVKELRKVIREQIDHYPKSVLHSLMNILSTHDTVRLLTAVGGINMSGISKDEMSKTFIPESQYNIAKNKLKIASLLQFTLCGVPSIYYGDEAGMQGYVDPLNRKCYPWGKEDKEIISWYKFLSKLRNTYDAFTDGDYEEIYADNGMFVFKRIGKSSEIGVAVNLSNVKHVLSFDGAITNLADGATIDNDITLSYGELLIFKVSN